MNRFTDVNNIQIEKALEEQRMLIVILQRDEPKGKGATPRLRSMFNFTDDTSLVLQEWQGDKSLGSLYPENNSNPDFVFRYGQQQFAIECKWRESLRGEKSKNPFTEKNIENYNHFSKERKMPVTIVLGIGGEPCNPEWLYIIPLENIAEVSSTYALITKFQTVKTTFDISQFLSI